jgi:two-component system, NtrC family, response regulator HydG
VPSDLAHDAPQQACVLVVLPESAEARELVAYLGSRQLTAMWAHDGESGYEVLDQEHIDALICAVGAPRTDALRLQHLARQRNPQVCGIVLADPTAEQISLATEAVRAGAYDYQLRPLNTTKIDAVLERGLSYQRLVGEVTDLQKRLDERFRLGGVARRSSLWQRIYSQVEQVARSKASVLIVGETGTGKGEVAKAVHYHSRRKEQPFVEVNCGALPEGIVESELFGHEKGAFTGATASRKGRFELADQGTLFLDEVGDLPPATQVKLLRVIQNGEFERVGGTRTQRVDVRLIAATNRDLQGMVEAGSYRADLFYRLHVVTIEVPSLRLCREDIPLLVDEFIREFSQENDKGITGVDARALDALLVYDWPGNVRELKNCIEGMVVMCPHEGLLRAEDIPGYVGRPGHTEPGAGFQVGMSMADIERLALHETLKAVAYDRRRAASILRIGLSTLYRKEKLYGLRDTERGT